MESTGELGTIENASAGAAALFSALAAVDSVSATRAARRVVVADLMSSEFETSDRLACILGSLLADLGSVVLRTPAGEATRETAEFLATIAGMRSVAETISYRHERVDGTGVPAGLVGGDIPLGSRVIAIADLVVAQRRLGPIDWDRQLEIMKDNAGTKFDMALTESAYDALADPDVQRLVESATVDSAMTIVQHNSPGPPDPLDHLGVLVETIGDPVQTAQLFVDATWAASSHRAVGIHQVQGELLTQLCVAGALADQWEPMAMTQDLANLDRPTTAVSGADTVALVPIHDGELWGLVWGATDGHDADHAPLIELAKAMEKTIERERHERQLDLLAHGDQLTGLANRRRLEAELEALFTSSSDDRADAALIMCDVDGLKRVNDTRGHGAGDDVLRGVALVLQEITSGEDALAVRLGGDEFCVLLRTGALLRAQSMSRRATASVRASAPAGTGLSCGIAYAAHADSPSDLLKRADEAQYLVKRRRGLSVEIEPATSDRRRRGSR